MSRIGWLRQDPLSKYQEFLAYDQLLSLRKEKEQLLTAKMWKAVRELFVKVSEFNLPEVAIDTSSEVVRIGEPEDINEEQRAILLDLIKALVPWRKGPFELFGIRVDAEWRSNLRWDRMQAELPDLSHKRVLDVGCNNGYYMLRARDRDPKLLYGIDPSERTYYQFELLQLFLKDSRLFYDLLGIGQVPLFPGFFHVVICMGILYHHRNPYKMLLELRDSMRPGGKLIVENIVIPGEEPNALCVPDRYAMMRNVYFIPTVPALKIWLQRAGFVDVEVFDYSKITVEEQRKTDFAPYQSLADFLDPEDPDKTVEGFPAPYRACFRAFTRKS